MKARAAANYRRRQRRRNTARLRAEAERYYDLLDLAARLGVPVSLDDPRATEKAA